MRVGSNPNRAAKADEFLKPVVLHVVTHLPNEDGYHKDRLNVIKTCLTTMTKGAKVPYSLIVSFSGAVTDLREWIRRELNPYMIMDTPNIGKGMARKLVAQMLPPDAILCYSDDDMLFYDNWLVPQMELLEHFPNVACVTGYPVRTSFRWGNTNTRKWAEKKATIEKGKFLPEGWERDFALSVGRDPDLHIQSTQTDMDFRIDYRGKQAYATSHHCQQIGFAGTINRALNYDGMAMGEERSFDERLDKLGLRLATTKRLVRHIGNVMDESIQQEAVKLMGANTPMEAKWQKEFLVSEGRS